MKKYIRVSDNLNYQKLKKFFECESIMDSQDDNLCWGYHNKMEASHLNSFWFNHHDSTYLIKQKYLETFAFDKITNHDIFVYIECSEKEKNHERVNHLMNSVNSDDLVYESDLPTYKEYTDFEEAFWKKKFMEKYGLKGLEYHDFTDPDIFGHYLFLLKKNTITIHERYQNFIKN